MKTIFATDLKSKKYGYSQESKECPKTVKILAVKGFNCQKVWKLWLFFTIFIFLYNPLTANDELSRHENLTFLWTWTLRWVPRSFATHASLCNTLPSNKLSKNSENPSSQRVKRSIRLISQKKRWGFTIINYTLGFPYCQIFATVMDKELNFLSFS